MSVAKIEQDIKLLEEELKEINTNICDPIERNEYKQELQIKLKKLYKTKNGLEQLQQEQHELEALKNEVSIYSKREEEPTLDQSLSKESNRETNAKYIDRGEKSSDAATSITSSHNSKKFAALGIIIGISGLSASLSILIAANKTFQTANIARQPAYVSSDLKEELSTGQYSLTDISPKRDRSDEEIATQEYTSSFERDQLQTNSAASDIEQKNTINFSERTEPSTQFRYFNNYQFPLASCGDKDPGGTNTWYPVYITNTEQNFNFVRNNFCRDAILNYREEQQLTSIQVASFTTKAKAEEFALLMQYNLGSGEIGESTVYNFSKTEASYDSNANYR